MMRYQSWKVGTKSNTPPQGQVLNKRMSERKKKGKEIKEVRKKG